MSEQFLRQTAANGVMFIACPALGVPHGFSTRVGGESLGPFATLNLGVSAGDDEASVRRNRQRFTDAIDLPAPVVSLHQVHGGQVQLVNERPAATLYGDALVSATPGLSIGIFTADCTPILLVDPIMNVVGAVHAGWRGTVARVVMAAVDAMVDQCGARRESLRAAIGPAIGPCCFEVGDDVAIAINAHPWVGHENVIVGGKAKPHVDLFAANESQLIAAGLAPGHIFSSRLCTYCEAELFYSWRRDRAKTGRMQAAIMLPPAPPSRGS